MGLFGFGKKKPQPQPVKQSRSGRTVFQVTEDCKQCRECEAAEQCPMGAFDAEKFRIDEERCLGCGQCSDFCDFHAVREKRT